MEGTTLPSMSSHSSFANPHINKNIRQNVYVQYEKHFEKTVMEIFEMCGRDLYELIKSISSSWVQRKAIVSWLLNSYE